MEKQKNLPEESRKETLFLDGLRCVACLMVIIYHIHSRGIAMNLLPFIPYPSLIYNGLFLQGYSGVALFFVLSGFLLFQPFARYILFDESRPSFRTFFLRRIFRTWPGYFFSLFIFLIWLSRSFLQPENWYKLIPMFTFTMDTVNDNVNASYWSLAVEWQFYLVLPFVSVLIAWIVSQGSLAARRWKLFGLLATGVVLFTAIHSFNAYYVEQKLQWFPQGFMNIWLFFTFGNMGGKRFESLILGMVLATIYVLAQQARKESGEGGGLYAWLKARWLTFFLWGTVQLGVFFAWGYYYRSENHRVAFLEFLKPTYAGVHELGMALAFALLILGMLFGPTTIRRPLEWKPVLFLGTISYSMYIWNQPIIESWITYSEKYLHIAPSTLTFLALYPVMTLFFIPFCWGIYLLIEKPAMEWGRKVTRPRKPAEPSTPLLVSQSS